MKYCVILGNNFEDVEAIALIDLLRRAKVTLDLYGVGNDVITSRSNVKYQTERVFQNEADIDVAAYDGILLPGGPGVDALVKNAALVRVIAAFGAAKKLLFAICAGPLLLDEAGLLAGKRYACFPGVAVKSGTLVNQAVVVDGNIVTSQGVGTALEAALKLVEIIVSREEADLQAKKTLVRI